MMRDERGWTRRHRGRPPVTQAWIADRLAALYERADMQREAEQERARARSLRLP